MSKVDGGLEETPAELSFSPIQYSELGQLWAYGLVDLSFIMHFQNSTNFHLPKYVSAYTSTLL